MKTGIFNQDFFPTPLEVIEKMLDGVNLQEKRVLEPSAGKGDIVDYLTRNGADVIACELSPELTKILQTKCKIIGSDFLTVKSENISHIELIIMNPPFSADEKHILHAWEIAPPGCKIISLCNANTIEVQHRYYKERLELGTIIDQYGTSENLGKCFQNAERKTEVEVSMVKLQKPGSNYQQEFEGFFLEEDPAEQQANAIMPYNFIRDLVNRYIGAVKIFDEQLDAGVRMNKLTNSFYSSSLATHCTEDGKPKLRNDFKKDLQKSAWNFIFNKMDMHKYATRGLAQDINKFVETQTKIPFTMRNIYRMLEIVIGTQDQRMDKALLEVFEKVTQRYHDNRFNVEGWKTNSNYLLNRKFILPHVVQPDWGGKLRTSYHGWADSIEDMNKALCHLTGREYSYKDSFSNFLSSTRYAAGELSKWGFFDFRAYKKGTVHFTFADENLWAIFNQRIAKILGYPLPENMKPKSEKQKPAPVNTEKTPAQPESLLPAIIPIPEPEEMVEIYTEDETDMEPEEVYCNPDQLCLFN
jgi:hypothetical protein